jgi:hypothetical protein
MAASLVATGVAGDGQTVQVSSLAFTIPAGVQAGDRLRIFVNSSDSALAFSAFTGTAVGSSVVDGPRANGTSQAVAIVEKTLAGTEGGSTYTLAWSSGAARVTLEWTIIRGVTGLPTVFVSTDAAATGSFVLPTATGTQAGSHQSAMVLRRRSGVASTNTNIVGPYSQMVAGSNNDVATAYAAGINVFGSGGYVLSSASGSVAGETWTSGGTTSLGTNYVVITGTGPVQGTLAVTSTGTLALGAAAMSAAGSLAITSVGTLTLGGKPVALGSLALVSTGTLTLGGKPIALGSLAIVSVGTLSIFTGAAFGTLSLSASGVLSLGASAMTAKGSLAVASTGTLSLGGKPIAKGTLALTGAGALTFPAAVMTTRVRWWNGTAWAPTLIRYWDGTAWQLATVKVWDGTQWA